MILYEIAKIDKLWVEGFQWLFDEALEKKEWVGQVDNIHFSNFL